MSDLIVVELTEDLEQIAAVNSYSGATGEWLGAVNENQISAGSENRTVVLVIDGRLAAMQRVPVPDLDEAKLHKILPGLMDEKIATGAQENQFALVGAYDNETGSRAICTIEKRTLAKLLARANALGFNPDIVVPDFVLLTQPEHGYNMVVLNGRYVVRAANGDGFAGEKNIVDAVVVDAGDVEKIDSVHWQKTLVQVAAVGGNFLHGAFAKKANWVAGLFWWKRPIYLALSAMFIFTILYYYNAVQNYQSAEKLYAKSENLFREALPDEPRIVNMEAQLRRAVTAQRQTGGGEFFVLVGAVVQAVESDTTASLETLRYDESDNELLLSVSFPSFAETTKFNERLSAAGMHVTEGSSRQEGGRVFADLRVQRP